MIQRRYHAPPEILAAASEASGEAATNHMRCQFLNAIEMDE